MDRCLIFVTSQFKLFIFLSFVKVTKKIFFLFCLVVNSYQIYYILRSRLASAFFFCCPFLFYLFSFYFNVSYLSDILSLNNLFLLFFFYKFNTLRIQGVRSYYSYASSSTRRIDKENRFLHISLFPFSCSLFFCLYFRIVPFLLCGNSTK